MNLRNSDIDLYLCQLLAIVDLQVSNGPNGSYFKQVFCELEYRQ